ncbi:MAG: hypothetical protein MJZ30_09415 [Paludibacteraceae bacterium]|nr:hypothetical protein [Paludibacteraceae bacterium]
MMDVDLNIAYLSEEESSSGGGGKIVEIKPLDDSISVDKSESTPEKDVYGLRSKVHIESPNGTVDVKYNEATKIYNMDKMNYKDDYELYNSNNVAYRGDNSVYLKFTYRMSDKVSFQVFDFDLTGKGIFQPLVATIEQFTDELLDDYGVQHEHNPFKRKVVYIQNKIKYNGIGKPMIFDARGVEKMKRTKNGDSWSDSPLGNVDIVFCGNCQFVQIEYGETIRVDVEYIRYPRTGNQTYQDRHALFISIIRGNVKQIIDESEEIVYLGDKREIEVHRTGETSNLVLKYLYNIDIFLPEYSLVFYSEEDHKLLVSLYSAKKEINLEAYKPQILTIRTIDGFPFIL